MSDGGLAALSNLWVFVQAQRVVPCLLPLFPCSLSLVPCP